MQSTITAIATAPGRGGIGIVRVSGPRAPEIAEKILGKTLRPRVATFCPFMDEQGDPIDEGVALFFPGPCSFTGEDVLELQGHGGTAVMKALLNRCLELGASLAEPGEFTRRAFLNNKIDLVQAESVADLIDATTEQAVRSATRSLKGVFSEKIQEVSVELVQLRTLVESALDFPGEEVEILETAEARIKINIIIQRIKNIIKEAKQGSVLREGLQVVLVGRPNVGKSSLLNRLAGEEVAIVTDIAGTTRDVVRQHISIEGVPIHLIDTAGLRETNDQIEKKGVARALETIAAADILILLTDASHGETEEDRQILARLPSKTKIIRVVNKIDLAEYSNQGKEEMFLVSAKTGAGIDSLKEGILKAVGFDIHAENTYMARARHVEALNEALKHCERATEFLEQTELFAEELALAHRALGSIIGDFSTEDLLGEIFSNFCIGK